MVAMNDRSDRFRVVEIVMMLFLGKGFLVVPDCPLSDRLKTEPEA
jgi:hypothetical protein